MKETVAQIEAARGSFNQELFARRLQPASLMSKLTALQTALFDNTADRGKSYLEMKLAAGQAADKVGPKRLMSEYFRALQRGYEMLLETRETNHTKTIKRLKSAGSEPKDLKIWEIQSRKLSKLFAPELGLKPEEYIEDLPRFYSEAQAEDGSFGFPIIVETRIPLKRQCELAGIYFGLPEKVLLEEKHITKSTDRLTNRTDHLRPSDNHRVSKDPYATYANFITATHPLTAKFKVGESDRGGTIFDGIALYLAYPDLVMDFVKKVGSHLVLPGIDFTEFDEDNIYLVTLHGSKPLIHGFAAGLPIYKGEVVVCNDHHAPNIKDEVLEPEPTT